MNANYFFFQIVLVFTNVLILTRLSQYALLVRMRGAAYTVSHQTEVCTKIHG